METDNAWVLFSINKPHTDNIKVGKKKSEVRLRAPKKYKAYNALIYETKKHGGCGKVIGEFTAKNQRTYRGISNGVPLDLIRRACISKEELLDYTDNGQKEVTEIAIFDLKIYDKPKELSELKKTTSTCRIKDGFIFATPNCKECKGCNLKHPPQSWCYVQGGEKYE